MNPRYTPAKQERRRLADDIIGEATGFLRDRAGWFMWEGSGLGPLRGLQYQRCRGAVLARLMEKCPECPSGEADYPDADYCDRWSVPVCETPVPAAEVFRAVVTDLEREGLLRRVPTPADGDIVFPAADRAVLEHRYIKAALQARCYMAALSMVWHGFEEPQPTPIRQSRPGTGSTTTTRPDTDGGTGR